jgi:DNA-binding LacI/PurR family transcriptional regulator
MVESVSRTNAGRTRTDAIGAALRDRILAPGYTVGARLPPIPRLASEFGVSLRTVHLALQRLEAEGYVEKRNGVGTFVASRHRPMTLGETAAVCMESGAHLYGDLWSLLMQALQSRQMAPVGVDTSHGEALEMIRRLCHADIRYFFIHPGPSFPWDVLRQPAFRNKPVIFFFRAPGESDGPSFYRIHPDLPAMARLAAEHLWSRGVRRLLVLGTASDFALCRQPNEAVHAVSPSIVSTWEQRGGRLEFQTSREDKTSSSLIRFDETLLLKSLRGERAALGILGTRDVEVWEAQQVIARRCPERLSRIELCGLFDTPWSRTANPPFTTVSVDVPAMVAAAMKILDALRAGKKPRSRRVTIAPRLVVREARKER